MVPFQTREISRLELQYKKKKAGADDSDSEESSDSEVQTALKSLNDDVPNNAN